MKRWLASALLLSGGCTILNPSFDDEALGAATEGTAEGIGTGLTLGDGDGDGDGEGDGDGDGDGDGNGDGDGDLSCSEYAPRRVEARLKSVDNSVPDPGCTFHWLDMVPGQVPGTYTACDALGGACIPTPVTLSLTGFDYYALPDGPFELRLDQVGDGSGGCRTFQVAIVGAEDRATMIGANTVALDAEFRDFSNGFLTPTTKAVDSCSCASADCCDTDVDIGEITIESEAIEAGSISVPSGQTAHFDLSNEDWKLHTVSAVEGGCQDEPTVAWYVFATGA